MSDQGPQEDYSSYTLEQLQDASATFKRNRAQNIKRVTPKKRILYSQLLKAEHDIWTASYAAKSKERALQELLWYQADPVGRAPDHPHYQAFLDEWTHDDPSEAPIEPANKVQLRDLPELPMDVTIDEYMQWLESIDEEFSRCHIPKSDYLNQLKRKLHANPSISTAATNAMRHPEFATSADVRTRAYDDFREKTETLLFPEGIDAAIMHRLTELSYNDCKDTTELAEMFAKRYTLIMKWFPPPTDGAADQVDERERDRQLWFFRDFNYRDERIIRLEHKEIMAKPLKEIIWHTSEVIKTISEILDLDRRPAKRKSD